MALDAKALCAGEDVRYIAMGREVCPKTKREHWQGWVCFTKKKGTGKRALGNLSTKYGLGHMACMKGSFAQNEDYCSKEGKYQHHGDKPAQGNRTDIDFMAERVKNGEITADDMAVEGPGFYHQYGRTMMKAEEVLLRRKFRDWMTKGIWYCGPTMTGKSHRVFNDPNNPYDPDTHYVLDLSDSKGW
jgi:hypothetical protein